MKVLYFGTSGQVGGELSRIDTDVKLIPIPRQEADFSAPDTILKALDNHRPDAVINAAAYTAVDKAEEEEELATLINGTAVGLLAEGCKARDLPLVHISTDYVFPGTGDQPYTATDTTSPCNAYGRSKRAGEEAFMASGVNGVILRTSWVFSALGNNFVKTMLRLAETRDELTIVGDQHGGPTSARSIAGTCLALAQALTNTPHPPEVHHFSGTPDTTWAAFAEEIFRQWQALTGRNIPSVKPIPTADYPTPAVRPANSRLNCLSLEQKFAIKRPDWTQDLADVLRELKTEQEGA